MADKPTDGNPLINPHTGDDAVRSHGEDHFDVIHRLDDDTFLHERFGESGFLGGSFQTRGGGNLPFSPSGQPNIANPYH